MISLLALAGLAAPQSGNLYPTKQRDVANTSTYSAQGLAAGRAVSYRRSGHAKPVQRRIIPEIHQFARGDLIHGFDPDIDRLELDYPAASGVPVVTVTDFPDGTGASVALNGVVVADVIGAQGLAVTRIVLCPVAS